MDWSVDLFKGRSLKMNEKITAVLKNIYSVLDVSAVYAAIFKRHNKHKWQEDESSHNHNREKLHPGRERGGGEKHRETLRWWSREGDRRNTHTHTHTHTRKHTRRSARRSTCTLTLWGRWYKGCTTYCCLAKKHFVNACIKASCTRMLESARIVRLEMSFSISFISFSDIHFSFL